MREYYDVIAVSSDGENLLEIGEEQEVRTYTASLTRKITPWLDLKAIYCLYRFFNPRVRLLFIPKLRKQVLLVWLHPF